MRAAYWIVIIVGVVGFALGLYSFIAPEFLCLLFAVLFVLAQIVILVATSIAGFWKWRKSSSLWPMPAVLCVVFLVSTCYLASPLGRSISDARFHRHLNEYSGVVQSLGNGTLSCPVWCQEPIAAAAGVKLPGGIVEVGTTTCDQGGMLVVFLNSSDVPLVHTGYLFKGYGDKVICKAGELEPEKRWYMRPLAGSWYRFSDQPGL